MSNENGNSARREALLGDRPGSYAIARHVRMSPMKVRRVVNLIRGMDVSEALTALKFAPQATLFRSTECAVPTRRGWLQTRSASACWMPRPRPSRSVAGCRMTW